MTIDWTFRMGEAAIVFATLLGPVLAVQAQKWIERARERKQRKIGIFRTLMATRAAFLSPAHVEALNAVPIEFYGNRKIVNSWKEYLDYYRHKASHQRYGGKGESSFLLTSGSRWPRFWVITSPVSKSAGKSIGQRLTPGSRPTSRSSVKEWRNCFKGEAALPWT
jgi:hypothetical protein